MKKILLLIVMGWSLLAAGQSLQGTWKGKLHAGGAVLSLQLNVLNDKEATLDSPDQGARGISAKVKHLSADSISVSIMSLLVSYQAKLDGDTLRGSFVQMGQRFPLALSRGEVEVRRPQTPRPPFPYTTEDVTFFNAQDGATLSGTLTLPKAKCKAVALLVSGSGQQNRDEELFQHKPFAVIAHDLAQHGIATLRYDDRGFGRSTGGELKNATTADFARDAQAGVDFLRKLGRFKRVGIIGHSEGASIAFMLGAQQQVDFIVSLAGCGVEGIDVLVAQVNKMNALMGASTVVDAEQYRAMVDEKGNAWLKYFINYNPTADLAKVKCPVLALGGDKDCQVLSAQNLPAIQAALPKNKRHKTIEYPGLNHLFQPCELGLPSEYGTIETTISEQVLADIATWLLSL